MAEAAASALGVAAGLELDDEDVVLTDPVRTWLSGGAMDLWFSIDEDMWPDIADDLTRYSRDSLERSEGLSDLEVRPCDPAAGSSCTLDAARVFSEVDVLLTPTTAVPAFAAEGPPPGGAMATPFTMLANLCWNPSISVPAGLTPDGLPVGLQITVPRHRDDLALRLARIFEQTHPWPRHAPSP